MTLLLNGTNGLSDVDGSASTPAIRGTDTNTGIFFPAADTIAFAEGGAEAMRINSSGNLGIGTTSPTVNLEIGSDTSTVRALSVRYSSVPVYLSNSYDGTVGLSTLSANSYNTSNGSASWSSFGNTSYGSSAVQLAVSTSGSDIRLMTASASNTAPSERMRIDSSGNLLVNTTAKFGSGNPAQVAVRFDDSTTQGMGFQVTGSASSADYVVFRNSSSTNIGSITRNGTSNAVLYNTTSDYRLKENVTPLSNALDRVSALKPVSWVWKDCDGATGEGFIAHEVQEIIPAAVNGAKDAVDEEGNIKPQGMDASYLVATLTAAIQEQQAIITDLKSRIEALEQA